MRFLYPPPSEQVSSHCVEPCPAVHNDLPMGWYKGYTPGKTSIGKVSTPVFSILLHCCPLPVHKNRYVLIFLSPAELWHFPENGTKIWGNWYFRTVQQCPHVECVGFSNNSVILNVMYGETLKVHYVRIILDYNTKKLTKNIHRMWWKN